MKITEEMYEKIKECFPKHRKPCKIGNIEVLNAMLYVLENGCKWRALPEKFGNWHTIYERINYWSKHKILENAFLCLQRLGIISVKTKVFTLDSTCCKVHPDGHGVLKKQENKQSENLEEAGTQKFIWLPRLQEML